MRGHRIVWNRQCTSDFSGRHAFDATAYQQPEGRQPGLLGKGAERFDSRSNVHMSTIIDILDRVNNNSPILGSYRSGGRCSLVPKKKERFANV